MFKTRLLTPLAFSLILISQTAFGQTRCGTVENTHRLRSEKLILENDQHFEQWIKEKKATRVTSARKARSHYVVPVVFHILHFGEPYGQGRNIPDEQIYSQLRVLNEDFQRRNADAANTPADFEPVAGNMDIEFVLARTDPDGKPTTGIKRVRAPRDSYFTSDEFEFKALSYWPAEDYLNIWVLDLLGFLGYAQYPVSDLPGMEGSPTTRETDGLMIQYKVFGSIDDGNFDLKDRYDKGRTVSHEMGHFFGLKHIWGDDTNCLGNDFVDDTPKQNDATAGCPKHPHKTCDPAIVSMFMNFMDYTDDACMNMFTMQQVERMKVVIENSPRRKTLLTSPGLEYPEPVANDLAFVETNPIVQCTHTIVPMVKVKNQGNNLITSADIRISAAGQTIETKKFTLSLEPGDTATVVFSQTVSGIGVYEFDFEVLKVNGVTDANFYNNEQSLNVVVNESEDFSPMKQDFEKPFEEAWTIINPNDGMEWDTIATNFGYSLYFNSFNNFSIGDQSWLVSPTLDLSHADAASVLFDLSYAGRLGEKDEFSVYVSDDCGMTYKKTDYSPPSAIESTAAWIPEEESDWFLNEYINLSEFAGQPDVRIAFAVKNNSANNVYLDNIEVYSVEDPKFAFVDSEFSVFGYEANALYASTVKIGFHLNERQDVYGEVIDSRGRKVQTFEWHDVLNQVYDLPLSEAVARGIYVLRLRYDGKLHARRFFHNK